MSEKEELGKIEAKIEIISETKKKALMIVDILKSDVTRMSGGAAGLKEASKTAVEFTANVQRELQQMIQSGKLSVDVSNFCLSFLNKMSTAIADKGSEVDRAHYAKMGELRAVELQVEDLTATMAALQSAAAQQALKVSAAIENEKKAEVIEPVATEETPVEEPQQVAADSEKLAAPKKKKGRKKTKNVAADQASPAPVAVKEEKMKKNTFDNVWENVLKMKKRG
jgi:hypothetical protein